MTLTRKLYQTELMLKRNWINESIITEFNCVLFQAECDEIEDIIRLIEHIRNGSADGSQKLAIVTRTLALIRTIKQNPQDEKSVTEMAYLLQACRGKS